MPLGRLGRMSASSAAGRAEPLVGSGKAEKPMAGLGSVRSAGTQGPTGIYAAGSANTKTPAASPWLAGMDSAGPDKHQAKAHPTSFDPDSVLPKEVDFVPWAPPGLVRKAEKRENKRGTHHSPRGSSWAHSATRWDGALQD